MHLVDAGAKLDVRNNRGWLPLTIADGVYYNARVMMNKHTAQLLRELMAARGMDTSDKAANIGGALRADLADDTELDADNPSEIQQRLIEQAKKRQEILEQLQRQSK